MRPLKDIKTDERFLALGVDEAQAVIGACIDYMHKGQKELQRKHEAQAETLRAALAVINEYRATLEQNLSSRVINDPRTGKSLTLVPWLMPDSPVNAGPVLDAVMGVVQDFAKWLDKPHNINYTERSNRNFLTFLGRRWRNLGTGKPPTIEVMRQICTIVMGDAPDQEGPADPDLWRAFTEGFR